MDFWTNRMFDEKCEDGSMQIKDNHGQNSSQDDSSQDDSSRPQKQVCSMRFSNLLITIARRPTMQ